MNLYALNNAIGVLPRWLRKTLLVMRITTLILIIALMQVSAAGLAQRITLKEKGASLQSVIQKIRIQTGYDFLADLRTVEQANEVSINVKDAPLESVLDELFKGQDLTYSIKDKLIVLKPKTPSFLDRVVSAFADITVYGRVIDADGNPIPGASVKVKGTNKSAVSGQNGAFTIKDVDENATIVISYIGFVSRELKAEKNMGDVRMEAGSAELEEVEINAGYYTVTDRERTGNISRITSRDIEKQPVNNALLALQNRVPGLVITQKSGLPGGEVDVQIRGKSSVNDLVRNEPLYVINGVVFPSTNIVYTNTLSPMSLMNPSDIESIEVLKDADATAIYGSRGANGVVLVKTKSGTSGDMKVGVNIQQGFGEVDRRLKLLNTEEYLEIRREALKNDGVAVGINDFDLNGSWDNSRYTDWQKEMIGGKASITNASMSLSGGSDKAIYLVGGNFYKEGTVFPNDNDYRRGGINASLNLGSKKDRLNVALTLNYTNVKAKSFNSFMNFIYLAPNAPNPYDAEGQLNWNKGTFFQNPMAALLKKDETNTDNIISNINIQYRILNSFQFKVSTGYNVIKRSSFNSTPLASIAPMSSPAPTALNRTSSFGDNANYGFIVEPQLSYETKLGIGVFEGLIGGSYQTASYEQRTIDASNFNSDAVLHNITAASTLRSTLLRQGFYKYLGVFTRLNYNIKSRYLFNLTARRDGSSRFGEDKKFANFGAAGAAWIFSDEGFMKGLLPVVNFGKLRGSYGITGNDQIPDYQYVQLWYFGTPYQGNPILHIDIPINNDFAWETNRKLEAAIQLGLFGNIVNLELTWFRNRSSNQLIGDPLPPSTGYSSITANRPATVQNSGWELTSNLNAINRENFKWSLGLNLNIPKNKLIAYPGLETSSDAFKYLIGEPLSIRRVYNVRGIDSQTGLYDFEDYDGNGVINNNDRYLHKFTGIYFYGGFQNTVRFKQFNLDFLFSFTKQNSTQNYNSGNPNGSWSRTNPGRNMPTIVLNRWQKPGDETFISKASNTTAALLNVSGAVNNGGENIQNADFMRLKNIALSYQLPSGLLSRLKISNANIVLQGQNVFTWSKFIGLDPESQSRTSPPPLRQFTIGLNATF